jgi:uncharacterized protein YbjT (DUF2867 family)
MDRTTIVLGGTGLVGGHLVRVLSADEGVGAVVAPVRRAVTLWADDPRIAAPVVDFDALDDHRRWLTGDQLFICLGTTRKKAGSKEAFRRVDCDYVIHAARVAADAGVQEVFLVSSAGANAGSAVFYSRVKGEAEAAVSALPFRTAFLLRPSILVGDRQESRSAERMGIFVGRLLAPLMVGPARRYRPIEALAVACAMAHIAREPKPGVHVLESEQIQALADLA